MAAGAGRRLRPVTERYAKPVLPIDGRPVIVTVLRELQDAGVGRITVVTGHLADQVERLLEGFPHDLRFVSQPEVLGSADAVRRAELEPPYLVVAADTVVTPGDMGRFLAAARGHDGAIAVRRQPPPGPGRWAVRVEGGLVTALPDDDPANPLSGAPLWFHGDAVWRELQRELPGPPFEQATAFQRAIASGARIAGVEIGPTRDLTDPLDLVVQNFALPERPMSDVYDNFQEGRRRLRNGQAAQATVPLEKAKRREPAKASIRESLGIAYFRLGRYSEAEAEFRAALDISPVDDYAHYALGRCLEKLGRMREANAHYKLARSLRPGDEIYESRVLDLD